MQTIMMGGKKVKEFRDTWTTISTLPSSDDGDDNSDGGFDFVMGGDIAYMLKNHG